MSAAPDYVAIRVLMMPRDTNAHGTIFGGVLLSYIDQAGAVEARRHTNRKLVSVAMDQVVFKEPVFVGDIVTFRTSVARVGRTSLAIDIAVEADRFDRGAVGVPVTSARVVYVAVDDNRRPIPIEV